MYEFTPMYPDHTEENLKWLEFHKWRAPVVSPLDCYHSTRCKIIFTLFSPTSLYHLYMTLIWFLFYEQYNSTEVLMEVIKYWFAKKKR